jgi:LEA14-like dessication related protein
MGSWLVFSGCALLTLGSCARPSAPTIRPEKATVMAITERGIDLQVELQAVNPNRVDLSARSITAKVTLNGKYDIGTMTVPSGINLPAGKPTELVIPLSMKWNDIAALAGLASVTESAIPYSVEGIVTLGGDLIHADVPFRMEGSLPKDQLIAAALRSLPPLPFLGLPPAIHP